MANDIVVPSSLEGTRFTTDLTGRLVDTLIAQNVNFVDEVVEDPLDLAFGNKERVVTGPQKLIQKWFISFLTKRGSIQTNPNYGTNFMRRLEQGRIITDADVRLEFSEAAGFVADTLDEIDADKPDDERLDRAELLEFSLSNARLKAPRADL